MKTIYTLLPVFFIFSLFTLRAFSQTTIGITGNAGFSQSIFSIEKLQSSEVNYAPSWNLGIVLAKSKSEKFSYGAELLWTRIRSKIKYDKIFYAPSEALNDTINHLYKTNIDYIALPFYVKFQQKHLGLKLGFHTALHLNSKSFFIEERDESNNEKSEHGYILAYPMPDYVIDLGGKIGLDFSLRQNLLLRLDYFHGFLDKYGMFSLKFSNSQMTLGLTYNFF